VRERHALRSVLQGSFILLFWSMITGDIASLSSIGSALPVMLAESRYSRTFEFEADEGAAHYLIAQGWGTEPMQRILAKLDASENPSTTDTVMETLSTHPLTRKRIERLQNLDASE
jgi:Zn-dependent protease with chaperone function